MAIRPVPKAKHKQLSDLIGSAGLHGFAQNIAFPAVSFWLATPGFSSDPGAGQEAVNGRGYLTPFYLPSAITLALIGCQVAVGGAAGAVVRMGFYTADPVTFHPRELVVDAGTVTTTAGGLKTIALAEPIGEGFYWGVIVPQGSPVTQARFWAVNGASQYNPSVPFKAGASLISQLGGYAVGGVDTIAGALPDPWPHGLETVAIGPIMGIKKA